MIVGSMVILCVGYGAHKLSQLQVEQIKQHTGKNADDLSERKLEAAMDKLGIEGQEPTDQKNAMLEAEKDKNPSVLNPIEGEKHEE
jgi:hypothetical protein